MKILNVETSNDWIRNIASIPIIGAQFIFFLTTIPAVLCSFAAQGIFPSLNNEMGFTKSLLILLPTYNFILWNLNVKTYFFFIPTWIFYAIVSLLKAISLL